MLFLLACNSKNSQKLVSFEDMVKVTTDLTIIEGGLRLDFVSSEFYDKKDLLFFQVCQLHQIDTADYTQTFKYYSENPEKLMLLFEKVTENITLEKSKYLPPEEVQMGGYAPE